MPRDVGRFQKRTQRVLGLPHAGRQAMWMAVGPTHAATCAAAGEMRPLQVTEVFVVKLLAQGLTKVFKGVDGAVFGVKKRPAVGNLCKGIAHDVAHANSSVYRVARRIDRAGLVDVDCREIERGVAKDVGLHAEMGLEPELRTEDGGGLQVGAAVSAKLHVAHVRTEVGDKVVERFRLAFGMGGMNFVPEIPGEQGSGAAPALSGEGEPGLDGVARGTGEQRLRRVEEGASVGLVVGMMLEAKPHPKSVERGEQQPDVVALRKDEDVIPKPDHVRRPLADGGLEIPGTDLCVLKHETHAGDAAGSETTEPGLDRGKVPAAVEGLELRPGDSLVGSDRVPRRAVL